MGVSSLAGLGTMLIFIPLNGFISNKAKVLQTKKLKVQDSRIKLTNEILNGIKVLKLYGWELSFYDIINKIRTSELAILLKQGIYSVIIMFSWASASFLVATASIICFILINAENNLDASKAFVSLTLFNIIRFPLVMLPQIITSLIQANVSMTRIRQFLLRDEIDESQVGREHDATTAVLFENVDLGWSSEQKFLQSINIRVKRGELVAIIGPVGSGKSSLLSGLLGEMYKFGGKINVSGSMSFVAQQAWIQNATLKENILFGRPYDEQLYNRVVDACALRSDFAILPGGDKTEIGEKGINLSGGQKQRVSLARAVYSNADIVVLDDPLSAVDAHVGKHIFDSVIGPNGLLKDKTRVFVTNSLSFIPECDNIVYLNEGKVEESGSYDTLRANRDGPMSKFIQLYFQNSKAEQDDGEGDGNEEKKKKKNKEEEANETMRKMSKMAEKSGEKADGAKAGETLMTKEKIETGRVNMRIE